MFSCFPMFSHDFAIKKQHLWWWIIENHPCPCARESCVMPPGSWGATLVPQRASSKVVLPWLMWPSLSNLGMILDLCGDGSKPYTHGEPQNSWDLWMFIPLKCIHRYWPIAISLGILAFYWPQNASNLLCFSWILNEIDSIFLDRKLWTKTCARRLGTLVLPCNMSRSAETQGLKISPDPRNSTYFYIAHRIHVWYIC